MLYVLVQRRQVTYIRIHYYLKLGKLSNFFSKYEMIQIEWCYTIDSTTRKHITPVMVLPEQNLNLSYPLTNQLDRHAHKMDSGENGTNFIHSVAF